MKVPTQSWTLLYKMNKRIIPEVHKEIERWKEQAVNIPDPLFKEQAMHCLTEKTFHCEGGGSYALLAPSGRKNVIRFIVAYQTIADYLDNLCDKSESQDPDDFRALHEAMEQALHPDMEQTDYYRYRNHQGDNGFLVGLVETCQQALLKLPGFYDVQNQMEDLSRYYRDLQVYKHVREEDRIPLLKEWFEGEEAKFPGMHWFEFAASTGSTLGVYSLAGYASQGKMAENKATLIKNGYFPWVQGFHILLDYFIDQEEDLKDGELNFCFYYENEDHLVERFTYFKAQAEKHLQRLPDAEFHKLLNRGIMALYLADEKVQKQKEVKETAKRFVRLGGLPTIFFYVNSWMFRKNYS
ncbi:tetraprenyl-beta-curcumene synthase family protein [Salsuginibacillus kocurii]|uniref:tetraprenyl-beta-curcumene synthase family protein n=1 Tax=Salsuginibacillus kocurii TaxID=427078 RepID=UPI00037B4955|nr:tetraprenyl-beta-curcumene synthase family protein [Salsuginibacillus kocurii]